METDNSFVSVLMCVYNEDSSYIMESVESILNQTYKDFEFIIVCDNPDNKRVVNLIRDYHLKDPRITQIINNTNIGLTHGC